MPERSEWLGWGWEGIYHVKWFAPSGVIPAVRTKGVKLFFANSVTADTHSGPVWNLNSRSLSVQHSIPTNSPSRVSTSCKWWQPAVPGRIKFSFSQWERTQYQLIHSKFKPAWATDEDDTNKHAISWTSHFCAFLSLRPTQLNYEREG